MTLTLAHLYPKEMNIYGDRGNVIALGKRLLWRGHKLKIVEIEPGSKTDLTKVDLIFGGGGQDRGQSVIGKDLLRRRDQLHQAAAEGVTMLTICGTYQLFGHGFTTLEGEEIPGIGLFNMHTTGSAHRMIGNIIVDTPFGELVGFENHSGQTRLESGQQFLGRVKQGYGNNQTSKEEGAIMNNVFGTYLHGPLLPKNPALADELISRAFKRRDADLNLSSLDDSLEQKAAQIAKHRR